MTTIEQLLDSTGTAIHDEVASRLGPPASAVRRQHRTRRRRRTATVGLAVVVAVIAGIGYTSRDATELHTADQTARDGDAVEDPGTGPSDEGPDLSRTLLATPIGGDEPRYVRLWTLTLTDTGSSVLLSEQWYERDGTAHASTALLSDPGQGLSGDDQEPAAWANLDHVPPLSDTLREETRESDFGYPERRLPSEATALASILANPDAPGAESPGVFITISSSGGADSSYLPPEATTVHELVRLLPTIMETPHREAAFEVLSNLEGADVRQQVRDMLGRASTVITIPLPITDPTDGSALGRLEASFWFDPQTSAPHEIEWQLVDGILPDSTTTLVVDRTVIIAAGEVATIPAAATAEPGPSVTPTTISPSEIFRDAIECLGAVDPTGPPTEADANTSGIRIESTYVDPESGKPTIEVFTTRPELGAVGGPADRCSETHRVDIEVAYVGPSVDLVGGWLHEPAFSGDEWQLAVGEEANGASGTFKVCHTFLATGEPPTQGNGLGTAGCSDWPSTIQPEVVIVHAAPAILTDDLVVVFIDLGTVPVETIVALHEDGSRADVTPFTMPRSLKQFAVLELPGGAATVTIQAVGNDGTILDSRDLTYLP